MATVIPLKDKDVWGVLWELDNEHLDSLDKQEGHPNKYKRKEIEVKLVLEQ